MWEDKMSYNNELRIEKKDNGYYVSDVDVDGEGGLYISNHPYKTLKSAIKAARRYMAKHKVEYGLNIKESALEEDDK